MIRGVHHIGLCVTDLEAAVRGYGGVAGFSEVLRTQAVNGAPCSVLLRGANGFLELSPSSRNQDKLAEPPAVNDAGITHFCGQGQSIETVIDALAAAGFSFPQRPVDLGTGFLYAYGRSPDGAVIEAEGAPFARQPCASWIGHAAFATPDLKRLCGFYAELLGWTESYSPRLRNNLKYDLVTGLRDVDVLAGWARGGNISLEFWQYLHPATTPQTAPRPPGRVGYSHIGFEVESLEETVLRAVGLGASVVADAKAEEHARVSWLRDPDGNAIKLIEWTDRQAPWALSALAYPDILAAVSADFDRHRPRTPERNRD